MGEDCPPIARLSGDSGLVEAVRVELASRGIVETPLPNCDAIGIHLVARQGEFFVEVERSDNSRVLRAADDARSAATIIESWVRNDVMAPLLDHPVPPEVREPLQPAESPIERARAVAEPEVVLAPRPFAFGASGIFGVADDSSIWTGVDVHGCFQLWRLCLGARFQYALDLEQSGEALKMDGARSTLDFGVFAQVPFIFGSLEVTPGLGAGVAIIRSDIDYTPNAEVREEASGFRARGQLGLNWRFADHFSARVDLAADWAPFARKNLYGSVTRDGVDDVPLPGEPDATVWVLVGLEAGGI